MRENPWRALIEFLFGRPPERGGVVTHGTRALWTLARGLALLLVIIFLTLFVAGMVIGFLSLSSALDAAIGGGLLVLALVYRRQIQLALRHVVARRSRVAATPATDPPPSGREDEVLSAQVDVVEADLESQYPDVDPDLLFDDEQFQGIVAAVVDSGSDDFIVKLSRSASGWRSAIGLVALARRPCAPPDWRPWAFRRLRRAAPIYIPYILGALAVNAHEHVLPELLRSIDERWLDEPALSSARELFAVRYAEGERLFPSNLEKVDPSQEDVIAAIIEGLDEPARTGLGRALDDLRSDRVDTSFLELFARVHKPDDRRGESIAIAGARAAIVDAIEQALLSSPPRSFLLVGPTGVGKSAIVRAAMRRLIDRGWLVFEAGAGEVMAGMSYIGELEGRLQEIANTAKGRRVVWIFPRFEESLWAGQHARSPRGMFDHLQPYLQTGQLTIVGELDLEGYETLTRERAATRSMFDAVRVPVPTDQETLAIADDYLENEARIDANEDTLKEAAELSAHYMPRLVAPGNLIRVLRLAVERARRADPGATQVVTSDVLEALEEASGLPLHILDPRKPVDLTEVRGFFEERVLGQSQAVEALVERISLIKAGLTDPTRPLGVYLFVGPTGTGKTEIAKALAAFVFGSEERLMRLDMSEFQTPDSLERLLSDSGPEERGAALISAVRREPFSVILLDEFEKSHPQVWDVFLQIFDDGRLTDQVGRTVDFRHCVIILTSNLGSVRPLGPRLGFSRSPDAFSPASVERAVVQAFRPELLNRLDRIVVFRPLDRDVMRSLLRKELNDVLSRRGLRNRPWAVEWDETAIEFLLEKGFSSELGARPLKRAVEQHLLAPLSEAIVEGTFPEGEQFLFVTARDGRRIQVTFVDPDADEGPEMPHEAASLETAALTLRTITLDPRGSEEEAAYLQDAAAQLRERFEAGGWARAKGELLGSTQQEAFWENTAAEARDEVLGRIEYLDRLEAAKRTAQRLCERLFANGRLRPTKKLNQMLAERIFLLDHALDGLESDEPPDAVVEMRPVGSKRPAAGFVSELDRMYEDWAEKRGMRLERSTPPGAVRLSISGLGAYTMLKHENGLHVFESPKGEEGFERVSVHVSVIGVPFGRTQKQHVHQLDQHPVVVRRYRREPSPLVRDARKKSRTGKLDRVLGGDFDLLL